MWTFEVRYYSVWLEMNRIRGNLTDNVALLLVLLCLQEDKDLIKCVEAASDPIKWPAIAESISGRSGKQCRERYLNHLKPKLKMEDWSALEDALLFHMYTLFGSKWALMRKALFGRTDSRIKNRFHFLRRRLEKDAVKFLQDNKAGQPDGALSLLANHQTTEESCEMQAKIRDMLPHLAAESLESRGESPYKFGPFRAAVQGDACKRCNLLVPSLQAGRVVCEATGWCEPCTRLPPYVSGSLVRECLNLRKSRMHS